MDTVSVVVDTSNEITVEQISALWESCDWNIPAWMEHMCRHYLRRTPVITRKALRKRRRKLCSR